MYHFFVEPHQIGAEEIRIEGADVNHIRNVLRMKPGEEILISSREGGDYFCRVEELEPEYVSAKILEEWENKELPARIHLFQGLPKGDKMELIIQKAVELGHTGGSGQHEALGCQAGCEKSGREEKTLECGF